MEKFMKLGYYFLSWLKKQKMVAERHPNKTLELIRAAACYAIKMGGEKVDVDMLRRANKNPWGY